MFAARQASGARAPCRWCTRTARLAEGKLSRDTAVTGVLYRGVGSCARGAPLSRTARRTVSTCGLVRELGLLRELGGDTEALDAMPGHALSTPVPTDRRTPTNPPPAPPPAALYTYCCMWLRKVACMRRPTSSRKVDRLVPSRQDRAAWGGRGGQARAGLRGDSGEGPRAQALLLYAVRGTCPPHMPLATAAEGAARTGRTTTQRLFV